jgi:hypothetical protein
MRSLDPKRLALGRTHQTQREIPPVPRHQRGDHFLKGPIPWTWLCRAASASGRALHVAIALWFMVGIKRTAKVTLSSSVLRALGVTRHSAARGLKKLEAANLVRVERRPGRNPVVTVLDVPAGDDQSVA